MKNLTMLEYITIHARQPEYSGRERITDVPSVFDRHFNAIPTKNPIRFIGWDLLFLTYVG
jgi:hypothetical protein